MKYSFSNIMMVNHPFRPLALAGSTADSEEIITLMKAYGTLLEAASRTEPGKPVTGVVNLFTLGWMNGARGKMAVASFMKLQSDGVLPAVLRAHNGSFIQAFKELMTQQKLVLLPVSLSQFPLTAYTLKGAAKEDLKRTSAIWKELFGTPPLSIWLPRGAYTPGIDELLLQEGCQFVFLPNDAFPLEEQEGVQWVSPRGLELIPYQKDHQENGTTGVTLFSLAGQGACMHWEDIQKKQVSSSDRSSAKRVIHFPLVYENLNEGHTLITAEELHRCDPIIHLKEEWDEKYALAISEAAGVLDLEWAYCIYAAVHGLKEELKSAIDSLRYLLDGAHKEFPDLDYAHQRMRLHYGVTLQSKQFVGGVERMEGAVLLLSWEYPPNIVGGMARHVHGLAEALVASGREVIVLTSSHHESAEYECVNGVHIYRSGPLHKGEQDFLKQTSDLNLCLFQKAMELMHKHDIALIHTHDWLTGDAAILLAEQKQLPLISTIHATEHGRNNGLHNELQHAIASKEKKLIEASDTVIVCSQPMKEELRVYYEGSGKDIYVVPNGVEFEESVSGLTRFRSMEPFIFSIGRMVFEKGFQTFFEMNLKNLKKENIQFIIAGKGPLLETWREEVKKRGLEDTIHFVGYVSDEERRALFQSCKVAVFPSLYEPFGIVALEAMAFRKPVIAAATGGLKSFVLHKQTGLLFEPGNAEDLSEKIAAVLDQPGYANELGLNGHEMAKELYSWAHISAQTEKIYDQTVFIKKMEGVRT
ncbi:glycosyltransferase [Domibacillus sp. DTU_2020_1001157_1_SI_ALB_TIR_016]|uniref:glycosyltransferase n=1 Tax=Domibacillus sp. DTU_2020_1001157_1_SI_ALB_TIR_016 TaxID=3077789 RepID=UPI0028EFE5FF|nr:glycosyltransferase [Domibacillus sp. DTU_2020_1001157_1_SI_ALB_TIR_016]WNS81956.1 glycosyltransferase [Domibacillus sp. DTU_2020_1001157_1_SI_ALB_TIR_016]